MSHGDPFDAYVVTSLASGIIKTRVQLTDSPGMVRSVWLRPSGLIEHFHGEGREWHRTFASAKARAEAMRKRSIQARERQLAQLQAMTFDTFTDLTQPEKPTGPTRMRPYEAQAG